MVTKTKKPSKRKSKGISLKPYLLIIGLFFIGLTVYIGYRLDASERKLIPASVIALIAGLIFESKRLTQKWSSILWTALGSFALSFSIFLPGRNEQVYNFENHIQMWPYAFIFIFILISIAFHGDKIIPKLSEGSTLLLSGAIIYWVIDHGFVETSSMIIKIVMILGLIFSTFSFIHAFTYTTLSKGSRLTLSIWSCFIMVLFAVDNIYRIYQNEQIETTTDIITALYIFLQYFLLGVCSIYIVQNFLMLSGFLPGKGTFFNAQYFKEVKELKSNHIKRYSDRQVSITHSLFCVLFTGTLFTLNYNYQIVPRNIAIWIAFIIFPYILLVYENVTKKTPIISSVMNTDNEK